MPYLKVLQQCRIDKKLFKSRVMQRLGDFSTQTYILLEGDVVMLPVVMYMFCSRDTHTTAFFIL